MAELRFGILGGSAIARRSLIPALQAAPGLRLEVVASRSAERRQALADQLGVRTVAEYEAVLADAAVDAVYLALPSALHESWTLRALTAGKHVYCEKPAVLDAAGAARVAAAARAARRVFLEGYMFLHHPQHQQVRRQLAAGAIGQPLHVDAWFGFPPLGPDNIRYQAELGGGALNDAAGYTVHAARLLLGAEPTVYSALMTRSAEHGIDLRGALALGFPGGQTASAVYGFDFGYRNAYSVWGSDGFLTLERAFSVPPTQPTTLVVRDNQGREQRQTLPPADHFQHALAAFAEAIRGARPFDAFLADFEALASLLDQARRLAVVSLAP